MSTEASDARAQRDRRRVAVVLATRETSAVPPPGVEPVAFADACLVDTFEVLDDLVGITAGIAGRPAVEELLGPLEVVLPGATSIRSIAEAVGEFDDLVVVPADVPDLPGLVVAKLFRALLRSEVAIAPERGGRGCAAIGLRLPWPVDLAEEIDLNGDPSQWSTRARPSGRAPSWHRLRRPADVARLDPGLEGWGQARSLLSGPGRSSPAQS